MLPALYLHSSYPPRTSPKPKTTAPLQEVKILTQADMFTMARSSYQSPAYELQPNSLEMSRPEAAHMNFAESAEPDFVFDQSDLERGDARRARKAQRKRSRRQGKGRMANCCYGILGLFAYLIIVGAASAFAAGIVYSLVLAWSTLRYNLYIHQHPGLVPYWGVWRCPDEWVQGVLEQCRRT